MLLMAPRRNNSSSSIVQQQQPHASQQQPPQQQHHPQQQLLVSTAFYSDVNLLDSDNSLSNNLQNLSINNVIISNNNNSISNSNNITMSPMQTSNGTANNSNNNGNCIASTQEQFTRCCLPHGDCLKLEAPITLDDVTECVRVLCNNENCNVGQYMHRECFEAWEQTVLVTLKSNGRGRSWSDRQRAQNLWTKKGYDLVYKSCSCKCGRGHLRKDLEWSPTAKHGGGGVAVSNGHYVNGSANGQQRTANGVALNGANDDTESSKTKKKKRNRNNQKPALALTPLNASGYNSNSQQQQQPQQQQQQQNGHNGNNANQNGICNNNNNVVSSPPLSNNNNNVGNTLPSPNVGVIGSGLHSHAQQQQQLQQQQQQQQIAVNGQLSANVSSFANGHGNVLGLDLRARAGSLSSSGSGSTSPSASHSSDISISPIHHQQPPQQQQQQQHMQLQQQFQQTLLQNGLTKSILSGINGCLSAGSNGQLLAAKSQQQQQQQQHQNVGLVSNGLQHFSSMDQQHLVQQQKNKEVEIYSERVRSTSGCNGIFSRRLDFSSFNLLPKTRLNSYQVKIEDEGNHGNDETRLFILSSLAQSQMSRVACILCEEPMLVFDRYPLVDGSFFLSPKQHSSGCIEVKYEGRALYLTCVCMGCLDGTSSNRVISCRFCAEIWDGSNLVLGTMYAYDIFAAMPCCVDRLKCNNCFKLLLHPQQRLNFYSDYSHCVTCPYCTTQDTHFVKPISYCYTKSSAARHQLIA